MKENESLRETLKRLRAGFFLFYFILFYFYGKSWVEFGYINFWVK